MNIKAAEERGEVRQGQVLMSMLIRLMSMLIRLMSVSIRLMSMLIRLVLMLIRLMSILIRLIKIDFQVVPHCCFAHKAPISRGSVDLVIF